VARGGRLAVIGKQRTVGDPSGDRLALDIDGVGVAVTEVDDHVVLYRHGLDEYVPPHWIDHGANLRALAGLGCDRVLAVSSVGTLRVDLPVGTFLAPDDFIALDQAPVAATAGEAQHVVPGFTPAWRARVLDVWRRRAEPAVVDGGVYWQANGPRFETPAEIRLIAGVADIVGMTVASECVAANQLGLDYACIAIVDNLANGLAGDLLTPEAYERGQALNRERMLEALAAVVPELAA
jgi:5'-methylthioadenosine phosphorylase